MLALALAAIVPWTYWVEPCVKPAETTCLETDADLAAWALDAWSRATGGKIQFTKVAEEKQAQFRFYWAGARAGLYGEARMIVVDGKRGSEIYLRPSVARGDDPLLRDLVLYMTCLHESGHALGLGHTANFDDIMYNFQYGGDLAEYFNRWRRRLKNRDGLRAIGGYSEADTQRLQKALAYLNAF